MPSARYSFRSSTINAGIISEQRRNEGDARREQARARRQVRTAVSASSRVLEHPQNAVMPIAFQALASDQLVSGNQQEVTAQVASASAVSEEPLPTSVVAEAELVATATDPVDASPVTGSGIGTKRSSRSPSPLPSDKRRRVERSGSPGEGSSQQVAESSAAAMAWTTSILQSPAVGEEVAGMIDVDAEMSEATAVVSESPAFHLASDMEEVSLLLGLSGDETAPRDAPASPRALDAAESMLGLGWVQPVPTPLPSPDASSLMTSQPPPPPPPPQVPAPVSANDMEAAQAMLGLWSPASLPPPPLPQQEAPPSPRALDAAESMIDFAEGSAAPLSPLPQTPPSPQAPPSPRTFQAAANLFGIAQPEDENQVLDASIALMAMLYPAAPLVVSEEEKARRRQYLDANMPASPYNASMLDRIVGRFERCPVCLDVPREGETMVRILTCRHAFCQECIDYWLQEQDTGACATCRQVYFKSNTRRGGN